MDNYELEHSFDRADNMNESFAQQSQPSLYRHLTLSIRKEK